MNIRTLSVLDEAEAFPAVFERIETEEASWNPDAVLPVCELSATPRGTMIVPDVGEVVLTDWSRRQLATHLGIRWNKWFQKASAEEAAEEINRRFSRMDQVWKIRTRKAFPTESISPKLGVLGALVSPTYTPIDNSRVMLSLGSALGNSRLSQLRFWKVAFSDRSIHLSVVDRKPVTIGSGTTKEVYFLGFHLRNSPVGFAALSMYVYFLRLACSNGLLVCEGDFRLLYRTHRPVEDGVLLERMNRAFSGIENAWKQGLGFLEAARTHRINGASETVAEVLRQTPGLMAYRRAVTSELMSSNVFPTMYDLIQALTHTAKQIRPDLRFEMERLAGKLLLGNVPVREA